MKNELCDPRPLPPRPILLLAEAPEPGSAAADDDISELAYGEAAASLARAVFRRGGRLVVVGDDLAALLVATIAADYAPARPAEEWFSANERLGASLEFFSTTPPAGQQAGEEGDHRPDETSGPSLLTLLEQQGRIRRMPYREMETAAAVAQRHPMAAVALGTPAASEDRIAEFTGTVPPRRFFVCPSTAPFRRRSPEWVRDLEEEVAEALERRPRPPRGRDDGEERVQGVEDRDAYRDLPPPELDIPPIPPFALLMQVMVEELAGDEGSVRE